MSEQLLLPNILDSADGIVSHALVMARKKGKIGTTSARTLAWMFAQLNQDKNIFTYSITREQFKKILKVPASSLKREINKVCEELSSHFVKVEDAEYDDYVPLAGKVRYHKSDSTVEFKFNPELKEYLVEIKKSFSKYNFKAVLTLRNTYSFYMYLLSKRFLHSTQNLYVVDVSLEDFKHALGCAGKYSQYGGFKDKVLEPLKEEFEQNPEIDIIFSFEPLKTGNKVTHVNLCFTKKDGKKSIPPSKKNPDQTPEDAISTEDALLLLPESLRPERKKSK